MNECESITPNSSRKTAFQHSHFFAFSKRNDFILLLAISKQLKLQEPDCIHFGDNLTKINSLFFLKFLAFLKAEISLVEVVGILISKVVINLA